MIIKNSQEDIVVDLPANVTKLVFSSSGGPDSALLGFILAKYITEERPDIRLIPATVVHEKKPYQEIFSRRIVKFLQETFDADIFLDHVVAYAERSEDYSSTLFELVNKIILDGADGHANGITRNPPKRVLNQIYKKIQENAPEGRLEPKSPLQILAHPNGVDKRIAWKPFININKKGIAELYNKFDLMENLFPITRSCEGVTWNFSEHCGECWFCEERQWGFKQL